MVQRYHFCSNIRCDRDKNHATTFEINQDDQPLNHKEILKPGKDLTNRGFLITFATPLHSQYEQAIYNDYHRTMRYVVLPVGRHAT